MAAVLLSFELPWKSPRESPFRFQPDGLFYLRTAENCTQTAWNQRVMEDENKLKLILATEARISRMENVTNQNIK